ncbi:MAG: SH3 domain-containing protein [Thermodesulfobacteriota bacterium]
MPQCPFCNAAVWVGQQYCTTCTNPLPGKEEEDHFCPQCGIRLDTPEEICQKCTVSQAESAEAPAPAPARTWWLPLKVPVIFCGAGLIIAVLLVVFLFQTSSGPPQVKMTPPSPTVSGKTPTAHPSPASEKAPSATPVAAAQKLADPAAPAASSPPAATPPTPSWPRYLVNTHALVVRDAPDASAALIAILRFNDEVELLDTSGGWGKVRHQRRKIVAWANMRYLQRLTVSGQTPATPPRSTSQTAPPAPQAAAVQKLAATSAPAVSSPPQGTVPTPSLPKYFVNTHELTIRNSPTMSALAIATLNFKDEVELLDTSGGWGRIRDLRGRIVGWAYMDYLEPVTVDGPREVSQHKSSDP